MNVKSNIYTNTRRIQIYKTNITAVR